MANKCGCWIEIKAPGKKPNPSQLAFLDLMRKAGYEAFWSDSLDKLIDKTLEYFHDII
jgi:hypothetical protein